LPGQAETSGPVSHKDSCCHLSEHPEIFLGKNIPKHLFLAEGVEMVHHPV